VYDEASFVEEVETVAALSIFALACAITPEEGAWYESNS
jgi:hypothetical protein